MNIEAVGRAEQGARSEMQDTYFVRDDGRVMAVFDGHGPEGGEVAAQVAAFFEDTWDRYPAMNRTEQFLDCDREMGGMDGGTTATVAEVVSYSDDEHLVVVHNVGDSPAYVLDPTRTDEPAIDLIDYHNVENAAEVARMDREGAPVGTGMYSGYFEVGGVKLLAVSRAIGDHACRGVIARPSKHVERISGGQFIVVASDGVVADKTRDVVLQQLMDSARDEKPLDNMVREATDLAAPMTHDNATIIIGRAQK